MVHGCNAQGVMGSGFADSLRKAYPENYMTYREAYEQSIAEGNSHLPLGKVIWHVVSRDEPRFVIANAITQEKYGRDKNVRYVDYDAVDRAFYTIGKMARKYSLPVHYPLIGAGLANGSWDVISPIIEKNLEGVNHRLWLLPGFPDPTVKNKPPSPRMR